VTWRNWRSLLVIGLAAVLLQEAVAQQIVLAGAHPDLFLLLAAAAGVAGGAQRGAVVGFLLGLVADLFVAMPYGLSALCFVFVAFSTGLVSGAFGDRTPRTLIVLTIFLAGAGGTLLYVLLAVVLGQPHVPRGQLTDVVAVVSLANAVLALPAVAAMRWALREPGKGRVMTSRSSIRAAAR
jgi:rod shape-determining protein MreD